MGNRNLICNNHPVNNIYLSLSTNLGEREENLNNAKTELEKAHVKIRQQSDIFETEPWGLTDQPWFLNQSLEIETSLTPSQLLSLINQIEKQMGRIRKEKYGPRLIDIDILLYGDETLDTPDLQIPHPELHNRNFVLAPLAQIAPNFIHPTLNIKIIELTLSCSDKSKIRIYENN